MSLLITDRRENPHASRMDSAQGSDEKDACETCLGLCYIDTSEEARIQCPECDGTGVSE